MAHSKSKYLEIPSEKQIQTYQTIKDYYIVKYIYRK